MTKLDLGTVLVASDLTDGSDEIVRSASALAAVAGARLEVLHVMELEAAPYIEMAGLEGSFPGRIEAAERTLEEQIRTLGDDRVQVTGKVVIDTVHRAVLSRAEEVGADVIVLGPHRKRSMADGLLGSTADRVIRSAKVPSLIIRGSFKLPLRRVVTPVDLSDPARQALGVAAQWCRALGEAAEVRVVHVVPKAFGTDEFNLDIGGIQRALHEQVEMSFADAPAGVAVTEEVVWGEQPSEDIVHYASAQEADLIVLATHGQGAFKRLLIGSVAAHVARHASGPVLLVPPAIWQAEES